MVKMVEMVKLVELVKLGKRVICNWLLVIGFLLLRGLYAQSTIFFGNVTVESDSVIVLDNFDDFLQSQYNVEFQELNYDNFTQQLLQIPINNGYLFPLLTLEKLNPASLGDSTFVHPNFKLSWGDLVSIDTLFFGNIEKTSPALLEKDLAFLKHRIYAENINTDIKQALLKYEFLMFENSEVVKAKNGKYGLLINLQEKQANKFAGVAGYVPKTNTTDGYFTGQIDIELKNISGTGRGFDIFWSKVNENSQELKLNYFEPHLLRSSIFSNVGFNQTLRDTLVVIRNLELGFGKNLSGKGTIELTGDYETTLPTPSGVELLNLEKTKVLKAGLNYIFDNRDLTSNPSKGIFLNSHNYLGYHERQKTKNLLIQTETYGEVNLSLSQQLVLHFKGDYQAKYLRNGSIDYTDQIWFGGATSLRGYAEDFFAGKEVGILGGELRWITGYYSRIFVFMDQGYYKSLDNQTNFPFSFGIGMRLESRMGTIGLDYAFGEDDTFTTAKIHIHLENRF